MLCQHCGKQDSTIKITRIANGTVEESNVCSDCAMIVSPHQAKLLKRKRSEPLTVENILKELLAQSEAGAVFKSSDDAPAPGPLECTTCGLEFHRYKKTGMLGCPDCYNAFAERLEQDLRKIHGATTHVGEAAPPRVEVVDHAARVRALKAELEEALASEDYALAARLRDEIRKQHASSPGTAGGAK